MKTNKIVFAIIIFTVIHLIAFFLCFKSIEEFNFFEDMKYMPLTITVIIFAVLVFVEWRFFMRLITPQKTIIVSYSIRPGMIMKAHEEQEKLFNSNIQNLIDNGSFTIVSMEIKKG